MSNRSEFAKAIEAVIRKEDLASSEDFGNDILLAVSKALKAHITDKGQAIFPGFGRMRLETRAPRAGHNPKTGEPIHIPPRQVIKFKVFPDGLG